MLFQDIPNELILLIVIQCAYQQAARLSCTNSNIRRIVWPEAERMRTDHRARLTQAAAAIGAIGGSPRGAASIATALCSTNLDLRYCRICDEGATAIAEALRGNRVLKELDLSYNGVGLTGATALADALKVNGVLKNIDLCGNSFGTEGWCAIFAALRDNKENKIESWHLSAQGINTEIAKVLAEYVSVSRVLTNLNLNDNQLCGIDFLGLGTYSAAGITALAEALKVNGVMKTLGLSGNRISDAGAKAIGEALAVNEVLTKLDLGGNAIGGEGATALASALEVNGVLTELDLSSNGIDDAGAEALASALCVNAVLTELDLSGNTIGDEGATALASALEVSGVLKHLNLSYNGVDDEGRGVIRDAVSGREGFKLEM